MAHDESLFYFRRTTLADISAAGWQRTHSSGGSWWFTQAGTTEHHFLPAWVHELESAAEKRGAEAVKAQLRHVLGCVKKSTVCSPADGKRNGT